jgi:HAD superfamily hydrolase (TIGR01459 family)
MRSVTGVSLSLAFLWGDEGEVNALTLGPASRQAPPMTGLIASLAEISDDYDAILCDVWGVLHDGKQAFRPASDALVAYRQRGGVVAALTNAPRPHPPVRMQMVRLGVSEDALDAVVTSGDVTLALMEAYGAAPVHTIGPERDMSLFDALEARSGLRPARVGPHDATYVLCTGLEHDDRETPADYAGRLAALAARGLPFVCANPDIVIHRGADLVFCAGALGRDYAALGGQVIYAGKPHAPIYDAALDVLTQALGRKPRQVLAIGDGFQTDVRGAAGQGIDVLFVAGGIHRDETLTEGRPDPDKLSRLFAREGATPAATMAALV